MSDNRCICCGEIIPEGMIACPNCLVVSKRQATENKWIPVSDPPNKAGCYLVTVKHWVTGEPVTREAFWNTTDWLSCERRHEITPRVTHWMPMPKPAKE